jgi:hypothetical protein
MSSNSKLEIKRTVESMMAALLEDNDSYLQILSSRVGFGRAEYASGGCTGRSGLLRTSFRLQPLYPARTTLSSPRFLSRSCQCLQSVGSLRPSFNSLFYGDPLVVSLTADGLDTLDVSGAPLVSDDVTVSFDPATDTCELTSAVSLLDRVSAAKQQADENVSAEVNASWRIAPLTPPSSGAVLEGESTGNQIVFNTGAQLGTYYYIRFYAISGEDASEEGILTAGMFIVGGQSAKIRLPSGFYRVACYVGTTGMALTTFMERAERSRQQNRNPLQEGYINTDFVRVKSAVHHVI